MKVLITGATGLVGQKLVALCRAQNISVNYLSTRREQMVGQDGYRGFYWNPESGEIDLDCFNGVTAIVNLAGASISKRWTPSYKKKILSSRINSLRTLHRALQTMDNGSIRSFVSASAIGIYPNSLSNFYEEDEAKVDKSFLGEVTRAWEQEIDTFKVFNCKVAKLRIGLVLSTDGGALPQMAGPINHYMGAAFGSGNQWQSWIHITDLARIFLFVVENRLEGIYNGVGPNPVTNSKLTKEIANVLNRPLLLPNIPQFIMRALLGEMSYLLFTSQRVSSKKIEEEGFVFDNQNIRRSLENLYMDEQPHDSSDQKYSKEFV
ncbi:TIGR01777 family oxidoreductase [Flavobacteriaceae bacterium 3-367]|uniref:TIGR01777 family oxidoreductase n=1 Tax=Eudoraea algarum TaxID=3417568 RepID=UPI0032849B57